MTNTESAFAEQPPQQQVIEAASAMLRGELGIIEGSRLLAGFCPRVSLAEHDPDFRCFIGIDSETDHLPVGAVRLRWAAEALAGKEEEIREAETFHRARAIAACQVLLLRFQGRVLD